jgi:hypothetical protein
MAKNPIEIPIEIHALSPDRLSDFLRYFVSGR